MISDPETSFHSDLRFENSITPHEKLVQKPGDSQTAQSAGTALSTWYLLPETGKTIFIKRHDEDDYIQYITTLKVQSSKCNIQLRRTAEDIKSSNISTFYPRPIHVLSTCLPLCHRPIRVVASHGDHRPRCTTALGRHLWFLPGARSSTAVDGEFDG